MMRMLWGDVTEMSNLASTLGQIGPKWDKSGTFTEPKCTQTDLKKSQICSIWGQYTETDLKKYQIHPIWGQSDPMWMPN